MIENANDTALNFKSKLDIEKSKIHEFFFNQKHLEYEKGQKLNKNILGTLRRVKNYVINFGENSNISSETFSEIPISTIYQETKVLTGHTSGVSALVHLPNGDLASSSYDKTIRIWSAKTGEQIKRTMKGHTSSVSSLVLLPNGDLASGSWDTTIKIWNVDTCLLKQTMHGHLAKVITLIVLENGDLVSGSWDRKIKIWDLKTGICYLH